MSKKPDDEQDGDTGIVHYRLPRDLYERLDVIARREGITRTAVARRGMLIHLRSLEANDGDAP